MYYFNHFLVFQKVHAKFLLKWLGHSTFTKEYIILLLIYRKLIVKINVGTLVSIADSYTGQDVTHRLDLSRTLRPIKSLTCIQFHYRTLCTSQPFKTIMQPEIWKLLILLIYAENKKKIKVFFQVVCVLSFEGQTIQLYKYV